jgi:hypothetical protein
VAEWGIFPLFPFHLICKVSVSKPVFFFFCQFSNRSCDRNGCKRKYHLSCLGLPVQCVSPGIWRCSICTKERLLSGVYSVSEGIESLWDVKDGMLNMKHLSFHLELSHFVC